MSVTIGDLGQKVLSMKSPEELLVFLHEENQKKIEALGGPAVWDTMSTEAQDAVDDVHQKEMLTRLGKAAHGSLPEDVRRAMDFFVRAGCCMHKDLNAVKGGAKAMAAWYADSGVTAPVLLANKGNDVVISNMATSQPTTAAENHAMDVTSRGGVKAASLAGGIFNNKDDKKGQQDFHRHWFETIFNYSFNFPTPLILGTDRIAKLQPSFCYTSNFTENSFLSSKIRSRTVAGITWSSI